MIIDTVIVEMTDATIHEVGPFPNYLAAEEWCASIIHTASVVTCFASDRYADDPEPLINPGGFETEYP